MLVLRLSRVPWLALVAVAACSDTEPLRTAKPGVVFAFPVDGQLDVPTGTRVVVTFSDKVEEKALGACGAGGEGGLCLVGPDGPVDVTPVVVGEDERSVEFPAGQLAPGTTYALHVGKELAPFAENLPAEGPLVRFSTRSTQPRAAPPVVIAVNGTAPEQLANAPMRPMFESSTLRLVFSEPLDPRTVASAPGSVQLAPEGGGPALDATVIAHGIHVAIDPHVDLTPNVTYRLSLENGIKDLAGQALAPVSFDFVPEGSRGAVGPIMQMLRTRLEGDPGPESARAGAEPNVILLDKPLIGRETVRMEPSVLAAELGDPQALGGPIAFTIRRGARLRASGLDVKLGGEIPVGLSTGQLQIELITDGGGRMYRNPHQDPGQRPENRDAPLYVDFSLDVAVYATDPTGTAVLSQTVLGVQASGTATPTDGVLAIETVAVMDLGLLGVTSAPSNLVLELITSQDDGVEVDAQPPALLATYPTEGSAELPVNAGVELVFNEPVDLDRLRAGGVKLETSGGVAVPAAIESHGSAVVVRPMTSLAYGTSYRVVMSDIADLAGNKRASTTMLQFATPTLVNTDVPATVVAISPGVSCALEGGTAVSPGRCSGGLMTDATYRPFTLERDRPLEVELSRPLSRATVELGSACGTGTVRIEELSAGGGCVRTVPGTLLVRDRGLGFFPDRPWTDGARYRFVLVSGGDEDCDPGELCGTNNVPLNFDPLAGNENDEAGGPNLAVEFTGAAPTGATPLITRASPWTDLNGSGAVETGEVLRDENRAALRITGTTGGIRSAAFPTSTQDCLPGTADREACLYLLGAMPVAMGELTSECPLPGGASAPSCLPVEISPQAMFATSVSMEADIGLPLPLTASTGPTVLRIREPASGPVMGYIIDGGDAPKMIVALDLYMDAPDMDVPLSTHDLHSKPLMTTLEGPVRFLPDGRIAIQVANTADVPIEVAIDSSVGVNGTIKMIVPKGEMKLQLVSPALRGGER